MNRSIFDARHTAALRRAAAKRVVLAFDFDGTLAPIVKRPGAAHMRPSTRDLLRHVARMYPTVVMTGRAVHDAMRRLRGVPLVAIIGNHGLERGIGAAPTNAAAIVRRWRRTLRKLAGVRGIEIEDKRASVAIHYRGAADRASTRQLILHAVAALTPAPRVIGGKALINLLPDLGVNKGTALQEILRRRRAHGAIYVGDDVTDEDVFALPASVQVLTIRVGRAKASTARYHIASQRQIDLLLAVLVDARVRR